MGDRGKKRGKGENAGVAWNKRKNFVDEGRTKQTWVAVSKKGTPLDRKPNERKNWGHSWGPMGGAQIGGGEASEEGGATVGIRPRSQWGGRLPARCH